MLRFDDVIFRAVAMFKHLPRICLVALFLGTAAGHAGKVDLEAAEMAAELIGAPVYAKEGVEVGTVADIAFDEELQPHRLRMTTGNDLGLGTSPSRPYLYEVRARTRAREKMAIMTSVVWATPRA